MLKRIQKKYLILGEPEILYKFLQRHKKMSFQGYGFYEE